MGATVAVITRGLHGMYCNCIVARGGVNDEISPEPEGFPEGSGDISSYTPTLVTIQSFSITSTSQYFLVLGPPEEVPIAPRGNTNPYWASSGGPNIGKYCKLAEPIQENIG